MLCNVRLITTICADRCLIGRFTGRLSEPRFDVRLWPTPVISDAEIYTYRMVALWPGPEPVSTDGSLAAVDPLQRLSEQFQLLLIVDYGGKSVLLKTL